MMMITDYYICDQQKLPECNYVDCAKFVGEFQFTDGQ